MDLAVGDVVIARDVVIHPLLGDALIICDRSGEPLTAMSDVDLDRPTEIPTIAEPGKLPPGTGAALLNLIAQRAPHPLRYAGPYPTPALYRALLRSFRASAGEATFCDDVLGRALRLARDQVAVDFTPAPHVRIAFARGFTEVRDGVERAVVDGVSYEPLVAGRAELRFGGVLHAHVATFGDDGAIVDGPHAIPALASDVIGVEFPPPLRAAIAELIADAVPAPLAIAAQTIVTRRTIAWADLGARAARRTASGFEVHAAIWQYIAPQGLAHVAVAITEALAPAVTQAIVAELAPRLPA